MAVSSVNYEYITDQRSIPLIVSDAKKEKYIGLDTENSGGLDVLSGAAKLLLMQLEISGKAYIIDARRVDLNPLKEVLEYGKCIKVIQNSIYDYKILSVLRGIKIDGIYDPKIVEYLLSAGISRDGAGLSELSFKYLGHYLNKKIVETFFDFPYDGEFTREQLEYAAMDVLVLNDIRKRQQIYLDTFRLNPTAFIEFSLVPSVAKMELAGIKLDADKWKNTLNELHKKIFKVTNDLHQVLPDPPAPPAKPIRLKKDGTPYARSAKQKPPPVLNLNSPQQLVWACKEIGIDFIKVNKRTRAGLTNNTTLRAAVGMYKNEPDKVAVLKNVIRYRGLKQTEETFGENLIEFVREDGRIHAEFHQNGTHSGRFSCVPLDSEILTNEGWQTYTDVSVGQRVVGYNILTNKLEWTILDNIVVGEDVVGDFSWRRNKGHDQRSKGSHYIRCTPNHRWVANIAGVTGFVKSGDIPSNRNHKAKFSLWASGAYGNYSDEVEAGIIGWTVTDGHVIKLVSGYALAIRVSKPTSIKYLEELLHTVPHTEHTYYIGRRTHYRYAREFYVGGAYFTPIYNKILNVGLIKYALSLSEDSVNSMYNSMLEADGSPRKNGTPFGNEREDVVDVFSILATLLGKSATYRKVKNNFTVFSVNSNLCGERSVRYNPSDDMTKVWCPTTRLGTWIMTQTGKIDITGNSSKPNLQNIQKKGEEGKILRSCFVPKEGCKFVLADYSQIELRIAAELSGDETMLKILNDPHGDIHVSTASQMFKIAYDKVTSELRRAAKTLNFGIIYGMSAKTLSDRLGCSIDDAKNHLVKYSEAYPTLMAWLEKTGTDAFEKGFTKTIGGRIRWFPSLNPNDEDFKSKKAFYERVGRNHPVQGCSADMTKLSMIYLDKHLDKYDASIVNSVHDELCIEVPFNHTIDVAKIVKKKMIVAGEYYLKKVPTLVEVKIRDCWFKDDGIKDDELGQQLSMFEGE
jgi:DNA polymerase I-like protein with 3'-5' exonuclease and polymerase domains